jgi:hypothetical protein
MSTVNRSAGETRQFGAGLLATDVKVIERRLFEILKPHTDAAGVLICTLEEAGEEGVAGLSLTLRSNESFDIVIRSSRS